MSTALTQLYYHTMARPRVVSEKESLLEGESGPTPAEKTLPTPCQQDRSWPSLEDGERRRPRDGAVQMKFICREFRSQGWHCFDWVEPHFFISQPNYMENPLFVHDLLSCFFAPN